MTEYLSKEKLVSELEREMCSGCCIPSLYRKRISCQYCITKKQIDLVEEMPADVVLCQDTGNIEKQPDETARKISEILPQDEILAQIAEEHAEAAQAALKLRRAIDRTNPTPKTLQECWENLKEEIGDVLNCIDTLNDGDPRRYAAFMSECRELSYRKKARWLGRLEGRPERGSNGKV